MILRGHVKEGFKKVNRQVRKGEKGYALLRSLGERLWKRKPKRE